VKWLKWSGVTVKFLWIKVLCALGWLYTAGIWLYCDCFIWVYLALCFNLYCGGFILFCNVCVCVCVCFVMWVCVGVLVIRILYSEVFLNLTEGFLTLTDVFPWFFLSCKANARVKLAKTGHGPHSSTLFVICVVRLLFVLFYVLFVCKCVLLPGDNPIAVNKYIISYQYHPHGEHFSNRYAGAQAVKMLLVSMNRTYHYSTQKSPLFGRTLSHLNPDPRFPLFNLFCQINLLGFVGIANGLRTVRSRVRISVEAGDFSLCRNVLIGSEFHPAYYSLGTERLSAG
jgi:hypothetical protein